MADHFVLRVAGESDLASMVVVNDDGQLLARPQTASLAAAAEQAGQHQVSVLLPASDIVSCLANVPAVSPARLRQMLPFSLEDDFAAEIDELHFAPGERNETGGLAVSVIGRERLEFWLERLRIAGISPRRVMSEADAVADTPGTVTLFLEGRSIFGRRPGAAPFRFDELNLSELWQLLASESENGADLDRVVLFADRETLAERAAEIDAWRDLVGDLDIRELADGCLPRMAAQVVAHPGPDLLQGDFAIRSDFAALWRPWRAAAGFILALILFSLAGKTAEVWKLSRDDAALTSEASSLCAANYSSEQLASCESEMLRRLVSTSAGGTNSGFLRIMSIVGAAAGDSLQIENVNYRDGVMVLEIIVPSIPYLETFVQGVAGAGPYNALPGTTRSVDGGYQVRVEIMPV